MDPRIRQEIPAQSRISVDPMVEIAKGKEPAPEDSGETQSADG